MLEKTRHKIMCYLLKYVIRLVDMRNISGKATRRLQGLGGRRTFPYCIVPT